jgi:hypothetical protein
VKYYFTAIVAWRFLSAAMRRFHPANPSKERGGHLLRMVTIFQSKTNKQPASCGNFNQLISNSTQLSRAPPVQEFA